MLSVTSHIKCKSQFWPNWHLLFIWMAIFSLFCVIIEIHRKILNSVNLSLFRVSISEVITEVIMEVIYATISLLGRWFWSGNRRNTSSEDIGFEAVTADFDTSTRQNASSDAVGFEAVTVVFTGLTLIAQTGISWFGAPFQLRPNSPCKKIHKNCFITEFFLYNFW